MSMQQWQLAASYCVYASSVTSCQCYVCAAVGGGSSVRVLDLTGAEIRDIQSEAVELPIGQSVHKVGWSPDGQLLTVSTTVRLAHECAAVLHYGLLLSGGL